VKTNDQSNNNISGEYTNPPNIGTPLLGAEPNETQADENQGANQTSDVPNKVNDTTPAASSVPDITLEDIKDPQSILLISGPYVRVDGVNGRDEPALVNVESPKALIDRLQLSGLFVRFTRPDLTPVWVRRSAVSVVQEPLNSQASAKATLIIQDRRQDVTEDKNTAKKLLNAASEHADQTRKRSQGEKR
jgi:hypothetical protein